MENQDSKSKVIVISIIVVVCCLFVGFFMLQSRIQGNKIIKDSILHSTPVNTEILGNKADLVSFSISASSKVSGIMNVTGSVKNGYFFEANIILNILDSNKNILQKGHANATSDWMTSEAVSFSGNIDFSNLPKGPAYIEIHNDNASDLPENDKSILIPIIIQ